MLIKVLSLTLLITVTLLGKSNFGAITTGSNTGTYIQIGKELSTVFRKYNAHLEVIPSKGSLENLDALTGKNDKLRAKWAIVQSDALDYYNFLHFKKTQKDVTDLIKTLLPLYYEHVHIFSKKNKAISFKQGSVIKVGVPSKISGSKITARLIEQAYNVTFDYRYVNYKTGLKYLKDDKIDIYIDVISLPAKKYKWLQGIDLVELPQNDYLDRKYLPTKFNSSQYVWLKKTISGYKVPSILITNRVEKKYDQVVGVFLKVILNNYNKLIQNGHSKWKEAYENRFIKLDNMHPVAEYILRK